MRSIALFTLVASGLAAGLLSWPLGAGAAPEKKPTLDSAQKLPVDLPSVLIRGEDETAGPLLPGNKLNPDEPGAMAFTLPRPRTALDLDYYLSRASESVVPDLHATPERLASPLPGYQQIRVGTSGPHRYDLGAYGGRTFELGAGQLLERVTAIAELEGRTGSTWDRALNDWSTWGLRLKAAGTSEATSSLDAMALDLEVAHRSSLYTLLSDTYAQGMDLGAKATEGPFDVRLATSLGRVGTPATLGLDTQTLDGSLAGSWRPELGDLPHAAELGMLLGNHRTDKRLDWNAYVRASDDWRLRPDLTLRAMLGMGALYGNWIVDPGLGLKYQPSATTELAALVRSETWFPTFTELYLARRYVAGYGELIDQRVPLRIDLTASHRLDDRWHARAEASYLMADRWIAWRQAPGAVGLWQPYNPGFATDAGARAQAAVLGELSAQYQAWDAGSQNFYYRWRSVQPLGEIAQEAGTSHHSVWLRGKLSFDLGGSIVLQQLGFGQTQKATATGWQALAQSKVSYQLTDSMAVFARAEALPLKQDQPAVNFFAPDTLAVAGITLGF